MSLKAKDIANILGVSTATVSLVLNNKPGVSDQKRQEIIEKIKALGCEYLLKGIPVSNGNIGFVVYKVVGKIIDESPFFTYILEGINKTLNKYGYNLNFIYMNNNTPIEQQKTQLRTVDCKGFIVFGVEMQRENLQIFIDTGLPFVVLDNSFRDNDVDSVAINNFQGMSKVMEYIYKMGHKNIGYIRCKERITSFDERFRAYKNWLKRLGLKYCADNICDVGYSEIEVNKGMKDYFSKQKEIPTVFVAENDYLACNASQAIQEMGYKVPENISIIGFDDRPICQMVVPTITTINVPKDAFGSAAVNLLMDKMRTGRAYSMKMEIGTHLIERDSVKRLES